MVFFQLMIFMIFKPQIGFTTIFVKVFRLVDAEKPVIHFSPANSLYINKVFYADVLGGDVFTARATAKGQRRRKHIKGTSNRTLGSGCVHHDTPGIDKLAEFHDPVFIVGINSCAMPNPPR